MTDRLEVSALVQQLTLEEKASLCLGSDFWHTAAVPRLGIPAIMVADGPHGLRKQPDEADHAGLGGSVPATCFPTASALGSSWDPQLLHDVGVALGIEAAAEGVAVLLGPGINIKRSPLCGRNFEYFSEDPLLAGRLGAAMVQGIQSTGTGACVKHFAANNQETDRLRVSADVDERTLREIYLAAFEHIVTTAQPWTVMCSYNRINGVYASEHHWLLTEVLREEWGFAGLVMSDWGAVNDRVAALGAGLDLEMPPNLGVSDAQIVAAVHAGQLAETELDAAVARVVALALRGKRAEPRTVDPDSHHQLARDAAAQCAVLLKNDDDLLPLRPQPGTTIAVIGEFARTPRFQGAGSSQVNPTRVDAALSELQAGVPDGVTISFAAGFGLDGTADDAGVAAEAVSIAQSADVVVAFLGLPASAESEGFDRTHIELPASQIALLEQLGGLTAEVVVVLSNGSVVRTAGWEQHAAAIMECWLPGQGGGGAIADLLLGAQAPSGRLAETIPLRLSDNPASLNFPGEEGHVRYGEGVFVGYRGYDATEREVSYPFGHGLTYTTFEYADLRIELTGSAAGDDLTVHISVDVTNTGTRDGAEVVQVYLADVAAAVDRPPRELRGFTRLRLRPDETQRATVTLTGRDFCYWSSAMRGWVLEGGEFVIEVGASSRDIRLRQSIIVEAPSVAAPLSADSSLEEWLADPVGGPALRAALAGSPGGTALDEPGLLAVVGNFPLRRLARMPNMGLSSDAVDALLAGDKR